VRFGSRRPGRSGRAGYREREQDAACHAGNAQGRRRPASIGESGRERHDERGKRDDDLDHRDGSQPLTRSARLATATKDKITKKSMDRKPAQKTLKEKRQARRAK
jgi:hypothetical protein